MVRRRWKGMLAAGVLVWSVIGVARGEGAAGENKKDEAVMRISMDAADLAKGFPPRIRDGNKKIVYDIATGGAAAEGTVTVTRWKGAGWPGEWGKGETKVTGAAGFFTYGVPAKGTAAWHVNFADVEVFGFYGGGLLAQDEMQVAEHPLLASVREMLVAKKEALAEEGGKATPVLVAGVQRRVALETGPGEGRPEGLYGNRFSRAEAGAVRKAVTKLDPPTVSNIVAIVAPPYGRGAYTREQLEAVLETAYTGFRAAKGESGEGMRVEIHTGFWGCGVFGGNRTVMVALQLAAARLAGVDEVVIHWGDKAGEKDFESGKNLFEAGLKEKDVGAFLRMVEGKGLRWGVGDGN